MGISGFLSKIIRKRFRNSITSLEYLNHINHLLIDMNQIFHLAIDIYNFHRGKEEFNPTEIFFYTTQVLNFIEILVKRFAADKSVLFAVDGVPSISKIDQQRQRTMRKEGGGFDRNHLKPGTEVMKILDAAIKDWLEKNKFLLPALVEYSPFSIPNEGEHKITKFIRTNIENKDDNILIIGSDSDLTILSLLLVHENIYILKKDAFEQQKDLYIDIHSLICELNNMGFNKRDFCASIMLFGNDFLPRIPSLQDIELGFEKIVNINFDNELKLTNEENYNISNLLFLLKKLSEQEEELLLIEANKQNQNNKILQAAMNQEEEIQEVIIREGRKLIDRRQVQAPIKKENLGTPDYNLYRQIHYMMEFLPKGDKDFKESYQDAIPKYSELEEMIEEMCKNYIDKMFWIWNLYTKGVEHIDPFSTYKYYKAPLLKDLYNYLLNNPDFTPSLQKHNKNIPISWHMIMVLTPQSVAIPKHLKKYYKDDSEFSYLTPDSFRIDSDGKYVEWEYVSIIPKVDIATFSLMVKLTKDKNLNSEDLVFPSIKMEGRLRPSLQYINQRGRGRGNFGGSGRNFRGRGRGR